MPKYQIDHTQVIGSKGAGQYVVTHKTTKKVLKVVTFTGNESKVDQAQGDLTDIHKLLQPAIEKGLLRHTTKYEGEYDDIPVLTYQEALTTIAEANSMFEELPSEYRKKFKNDPAKFLEFTQNPANATEMAEMGMLKGNDGLTKKGEPIASPKPTPPEPNPET